MAVVCARLERPGGRGVGGGGSGCGCYRTSRSLLPFTVTSSCQECAPSARAHRLLDAPALFLTRQGGSRRRSLPVGNDRGARGARTPSSRSSSSRCWRRPPGPTRTPALSWDYNRLINAQIRQQHLRILTRSEYEPSNFVTTF